MHTLRYVSTNVCGRMRNVASTLVYAEYVIDKFETRYEHATVRWYTLSRSMTNVIPNFGLNIFIHNSIKIHTHKTVQHNERI